MDRSAIGRGVVGGLIAGVFMAMFAMIAGATYLRSGFFTPMYHIAAFIIGPETMQTSMGSGTFYFAPGPAVLGLMIHMITAVGWGVLFTLLVRHLQIRFAGLVALGAIYGLAVMLFMSYLALPVIGQGNMPQMVGWTTFSIEHALYGATLGGWLALARARSSFAEPEASSREVPIT